MEDFDKIVERLSGDDVDPIVSHINKEENIEQHPMKKILDLYKKALELRDQDNHKANVLAATALYKCMKEFPEPATVNRHTHNLAELNQISQMFSLRNYNVPLARKLEPITEERDRLLENEVNKIWDLPPTIMPQALAIYLVRHMLRYKTMTIVTQEIVVHGKKIKPFSEFAKKYGYLVLEA